MLASAITPSLSMILIIDIGFVKSIDIDFTKAVIDLYNKSCPHPRMQPEILNRMNFFILLDLPLLLSSSTTWLITGVIGVFFA